MRTANERGIALITTLLVMMLMASLMVGFTAVIMSDQRFRGIDRDRTQAFYAAHSGLEKLTVDLGTLFSATVAPTAAQLTAIQAAPPVLPGISYLAADGTSGYILTAQAPEPGIIQSGSSPWAGLMALKTVYDMDSTARTAVGGEVHLSRRIETVAIPVFQFGMFSSKSMSFFAGPSFSFGGRVHTNEHLFLAQGGGATLTLNDRVTAMKEIVRQRLSNGVSTGVAHTGAVSMVTAGAPRDLLPDEGSVEDDENSMLNDDWETISKNTYNSRLLNWKTGAKLLTLPVITGTGLVRRPAVNENATDPALLAARFFSKVSLRILLSDTAADITSLPGVTGTAPVLLDGIWTVPATAPPGYGAITPTRPPIALSPGLAIVVTTGNTNLGDSTINVGALPSPPTLPALFLFGTIPVTCTGFTGASSKFTGCLGTPAMVNGDQMRFLNSINTALSNQDIGLIGGYIKIELQNNAKVWSDVTVQILNYGIGGPNPDTGACASTAIILLQRLRDDLPGCGGSIVATDYWPNTLFDPREGLQRDSNPGTTDVMLGGVMHYVTIDVTNLRQWFQGVAVPYDAGTGATADNDSGAGFSVYFSDRRNNRNGANAETGEYGFEDIVNPGSAAGAPNGTLDTGEDVGGPGVQLPDGGNGLLEVYGGLPNYGGVANTQVPGAVFPLDLLAGPRSPVAPSVAKANRAILFRRALKLVRGSDLSGIPGLTIAAENPIYVQGDWNANAAAGGFADPHVATSLIADAVTLLSNGWSDNISYTFPYAMGSRNRNGPTFYRAAIIAGKGPSFPQPAGTATDFGTDGGVHNFLRYLEDGNQPVNYRGSLVTFFYSQQATGTFKCCTTVYGAPTRNYAFDTDFLNLALLPPLTPLLRDVNILGFSQELRPGR